MESVQITILFSRNEAYIFDVSPQWTVHQLSEVIAVARGTNAANILIKFGRQLLKCEHKLHDYGTSQFSGIHTLIAKIGQPRQCCERAQTESKLPTMPMIEGRNQWHGAICPDKNAWSLSSALYCQKATRGAVPGGGWRTIRATHGYSSDQHLVEFRTNRFTHIHVGLVTASFTNWNGVMGEGNGGFRFDCDTGDITGDKTTILKALPPPSNDGTVTSILLRINYIGNQCVFISYKGWMHCWSFAELGLPACEALYPAISCGDGAIGRPIAIEAAAPATIPHCPPLADTLNKTDFAPIPRCPPHSPHSPETKALSTVKQWLETSGGYHRDGLFDAKILLDRLRLFEGDAHGLILHFQELKKLGIAFDA